MKKNRNKKLASSSQRVGPAFTKPRPGALQCDTDIARFVRETVETMNGGVYLTDDPKLLSVTSFLVAASVIGANDHRIAQILGLNHQHVAEWAGNLRRNGLWLDDGRVLDAKWFEDGGMIDFTFDLLVAQGYIQRRIDPVKGPVYGIVKGRHLLDGN